MIENKKKIKYGNQRNFLHKPQSKIPSWNGIHSLIRGADARESAVIIYCM